jgi:tRNA G18 (ribose-2'-O)-methylase SpoU
MAEGEVVVRTLLSGRSRISPESLFLSERAARALAVVLETAPVGLPVYVAPQAVMDAIAGFPIHRGILAIGRRPPLVGLSEFLAGLPGDALIVAGVGLTNHDNVGALFRNAAAFGANAVLLDGTSCDPLYRKAIRVSVGASLMVPFARSGTADELLAALAGQDFEVLALSPAGSEPVERVSRRPRTALLVGSEGAGLPRSILERTRTVRIAMAPGFDSLNVATAAAIALHRLAPIP